jgi:hypothetical protein
VTAEELAAIPSRWLYAKDTRGLCEWLEARGLVLSLLELDQERRRRRRP